MILQVAVPCPLPEALDYLPPESGPEPQCGQRVKVPLGRRVVVGVITGLRDASAIAGDRLRRAVAILDETPILPPDLLALADWAAAYYHHPTGEVHASLLPAALRQGKAHRSSTHWQITDSGRQRLADPGSARAPVQRALLQALADQSAGLDHDSLMAVRAGSQATLRVLRERGWIQANPGGDPPVAPVPDDPREVHRPDLNPAQHDAVKRCLALLGRFQAVLLEGVTGSGKTEVYLRLLEAVLAKGGQALVIVPEIGLTPQLLERFEQRLSGPIACLHSAMADGERARIWTEAARGRYPVIIGTRSALFTPLPGLALIVIDEEHDPSLKQQDGFRYNARDLALVRGRNAGVPVILGSATPSLESVYNARIGRYQHLLLPQRAGEAALPRTTLLDLRGQALEGGLCRTLIDAMRAHLSAQGQVLLFLNRRGYAPVLLCRSCGWMAECPRCDARLTWHQSPDRLVCHHCGHSSVRPGSCGDCGGTLDTRGLGTERIELALERLFPDERIARIDRDTTRRKGALQGLLDDARMGRARILLGTQMLAKGHHLPQVTLVGIVDCDQGLFGTDFRAPERLAQMLTQVAGRAGRAERPGEVMVQTHHPDHPLLGILLAEGYRRFADNCLAEREATRLPPYGHLAILRAEANGPRPPEAFLTGVRDWLQEHVDARLDLLGPVPAPMQRRAGRYRAQLLLQAASREPLQRGLSRLMPVLRDWPSARQVRWSLDVDPQDML